MLTVREIYEETTILLCIGGYGENLNGSEGFEKDFICCLNKVILDLTDKEYKVKTLRETIDVPSKIRASLCNGTAMWLALLLGDTDKYNFFAQVYNVMRTKYKSTFQSVVDTMPR